MTRSASSARPVRMMIGICDSARSCRSELHAVLAAQPQIEEHQVHHAGAEGIHELRAGRAAGHSEIVLPEILLHERAHRLIVIDDQEVRYRQAAHGKVLP